MSKITYSSAPSNKARGLGHEAVNVGEALVPQEDWNVHNIRHKAEGGERRVKKQGEEAPLVSMV